MLLISKPSDGAIREFLAAQHDQTFSYAEVGATRRSPPSGYTIDHNRIQLGSGPRVFERASMGIRRWEMFHLPWLQLCWPSAPINAGTSVALLVSALGIWSLNACRVVYRIDESGPAQRFGFAYGTLKEHGEIGEERFTVEMDVTDDSVWYDIYAFSRPAPLTRFAYSYARSLQKRFARDSLAAMKTFVTIVDGD